VRVDALEWRKKGGERPHEVGKEKQNKIIRTQRGISVTQEARKKGDHSKEEKTDE